jgi:ribonuclease T2
MWTRGKARPPYAILAVGLWLGLLGGAPAQTRSQGEPGKFDFYVLALSWSPSYCASVEERAPGRNPDRQCSGGRPYAFVVHGLWPQYERGFPSFCQVPAPRIGRALADDMLDLMPSPRLVYHEWDRHGTCSGLTAPVYFEAVRKARAAITIPAAYADLEKPAQVSPAEVLDNFLKVNSGLAREDIAIECDGTRLTGVRICLSKQLSFRACPEVTQRTCRRDKVLMPAVRGGKQARKGE